MKKKTLILLVLVGGLIALADISTQGSWVFQNFFNLGSTQYYSNWTGVQVAVSAEQEVLTQSAQGFNSLRIENNWGGIRVTGAPTDEIRVEGTITLRGTEKEALEEYLQDLSYALVPRGTQLVLIIEGAQRRIPELQAIQSHVEIFIPEDFALSLRNQHGEVYVKDIKSSVEVSNSHGPIEVRNITGDLELEARFAETRVEKVTGRVRGRVEHRPMDLSQVGSVHMSSSFSRVWIDGVSGSVVLNSQHGSAELRDLGGDLSFTGSFADLRVRGVGGQVEIENSHSNLDLREFMGPLRVRTRFGTLRVDLGDRGYKLDVRSEYADLYTRLPIPVEGEGNTKSIRQDLRGGGDLVHIRSEHTAVTIE